MGPDKSRKHGQSKFSAIDFSRKFQILKKMGYSWPVRKIAEAMTVTLVVDDSETEGIEMEFQTILKSTKMDLSFDHETYDTGLTSSEKYTISKITIEDGKLKHKTHLEAPGVSIDIFNTYSRNDNELTIEQSVEEVSGHRTFKLKE